MNNNLPDKEKMYEDSRVCLDLDSSTTDLYKLMDKYAQSVAIAFADWVGDNGYRKMSNNDWHFGYGKHFTTEELYQMFFNQKVDVSDKDIQEGREGSRT